MTTLTSGSELSDASEAKLEAPATARRQELDPGAKRANAIGTYFALGVTLLLCGMLARVVQLQVMPGAKLSQFISERVTTVPQVAPKGDVLDRRGRICAATRFGYRVFVDPTDFPNPPGDAIAKLAEAIGMSPVAVAKRVVPAMERNEKRLEAREAAQDQDEEAIADGEGLSRFVSVGGVLEDWQVEQVRSLRIDGKPVKGVHLETRLVRETTSDEQAASLVGKVGFDHNGLSGAEMIFDKGMKATPGKLSYVRDAMGQPMWIFPGGYAPPQRGQDVRLSIDLEIQRIVVEEVQRGVHDADAAGARCVVLDPHTGEVLALVDMVRELKGIKEYNWSAPIPKGGDGNRYRIIRRDLLAEISPALARNRCVEDVYEPGSTFKPFMWSTAVATGAVKPTDVFNTYGGHWVTPYGRPLSDVTERDHQTWCEVLVNSSNIGMAQGVAKMPWETTRGAIVGFGFGQRTNLGLPGESPGIVTSQKAWSKYTQTSVAIGYEIAVTPLQMVRAFSAFCRTGEQAGTVPDIRLTAGDSGGETAVPGRRALPPKVAELTRQTMRGVTHNLDTRLATGRFGSATQSEIFRYEAFGKSGTARAPLGKPPEGKKKPKGSDGYFGGQYNVSFLSGAPVDDPRVVVLVVVDDPGPELVKAKRYYGAMVAGPINRRIMERTLTYLGVEPPPEGQTSASATGNARD